MVSYKALNTILEFSVYLPQNRNVYLPHFSLLE